jgi:hypothetical protein
MAFATLNGLPVIEGTIGMPRVGAWHASLSVDTQDVIAGACTLAIEDGLTLVGNAHRSGVWLDTGELRMVGGAGGLAKPARPAHYRSASLQAVLADILATAGEQLAASSSADVLTLGFPHWTTIAQSCGKMISALLGDGRLAGEAAWRVLPDGTIWVGYETWPDAGLANVIDYQDLVESPAAGWAELGVEAPALRPGTVLDGRRISYVEHRITGATARTRVLFAD